MHRAGARLAMGIVAQLGDSAFERACAVVEECLDATFRAKDGSDVPDYRVRLDAAKLAIAYREGLPVARQVTLQQSIEAKWDELEDRAFGGLSPMLAARESTLQQARARLLPPAGGQTDSSGGDEAHNIIQ